MVIGETDRVVGFGLGYCKCQGVTVFFLVSQEHAQACAASVGRTLRGIDIRKGSRRLFGKTKKELLLFATETFDPGTIIFFIRVTFQDSLPFANQTRERRRCWSLGVLARDGRRRGRP